MSFDFEIAVLIYIYMKNEREPVKTYDKIYYKNFYICNYLKQKNLYNLSKVNKLFYIIYKNEIDKNEIDKNKIYK